MNSTRKKKRFDPIAFFWALLGATAFFGMIYLYILEIDYFNLYLNLGKMILRGVIIGLVLGLILSFLLSWRIKRSFDKLRITLLLLLLGLGLGPLSLSLSNRMWDQEDPKIETVEVKLVKPYLDAAYGVLKGQQSKVKYYELVFVRNGVTYTSYPPFLPQGVEAGQRTDFPINQGYWGFEWLGYVK